MTPALYAHLTRMFTLSLRAQALADALYAIVDDPDLSEASTQIAIALSSTTRALAVGLDTPERFEVAA